MPNALLSALVLAAGTIAAAQNPSPAAHSVSGDAAYGKRNMAFEQNQGQTDASVRFLAHGSNYSVLLQPARATLVVHQEQGTAGQRRKALMAGKALPGRHQAIEMSLPGAKTDAAMSGERALPGYVNYITGSDRSKDRTGVPTFAATRVRGAYAGIDLLYYGTEKQLEYDFVVAPNADAAQIKLHFAGARPVLSADGALHLQTGAKARSTDLSFLKPVVYQQREGHREAVAGSFNVAKNGDVNFRLGAYDHARELVIDPIISYASYFGGSGEDEINGSTLNAANQLYAVGQTYSTALPGTAGEFQTGKPTPGGHSAFVTKFSADGSAVLWTTFLAGSQDDFATSVAVGAADQAYVVGYTNSCGANNGIPGVAPNTSVRFPFTSDAFQQLCNPNLVGFNTTETDSNGYDAFLIKLSTDGKTVLYGTPFGGTANDIAQSVVLDASGKVYIVGETVSTAYLYSTDLSRFSDVPSYPVNNHGNAAVGVANFPTTGNAFYTNTTESKLYSTTYPNGAPGVPAGGTQGPQDEQGFLTVFSADLHSLVYSTLIGGTNLGGAGNGTSATNGYAVAVNGNGIAFIGGNTSSASFPVSAGAFAPACLPFNSSGVCNLTGWLAAFDPTKSGAASRLFSTYVNGTSAGTDGNGNTLTSGSDVFGLTTDAAGNVIATGDTNANNFPTTAGTVQPACTSVADSNGNGHACVGAFVTKLTPTGSTVWSTYFGPTKAPGAGDFVIGQGVATDATGNVYLLGSSVDPSLMLKNAIVASPSNQDAFLAELNPTGSAVLMGTYLGAGGGVTMNTNSLHLDSNQNAYFSGYQGVNTYGGTYLPVTPNAFDKTIQGNDGFVVKMITQQQPTAVTLTASPSGNVSPTQSVTLTATVASTSTLTGIPTTPSGTVQFLNGTAVFGTATIKAGVATYTGTLPGGTDSLTAVYSGDSGFNGSTSAAVVVVVSSAVATSTTLSVSPTTATSGQTVTLSSTTLAGTTPVTAGTVTFTAGTVTLGTATVGANGVATTTITPAVGTYTVTANFTGTVSATNPNGTASSVSASQTLTVGKAAAVVSVSASTALAPVTGPVTFTARVTGTGGTPSGTVNFLNGTTVLGSATLSAGVATFTTTTLPAGTYSVSAAYVGDANFATATSTSPATVVVRAAAATTTTVSSSAGSAPVKTAVTFTATIASAATTGAPTGSVTFYAGTTVLGTATLAGNNASFTTSTLPSGPVSVTAVYSGDTLFLPSTSAVFTETITVPMLAVTATSNPLIIQHGHSGVLTLTLTPSGGFAGTVSFGCGALPQYVTCVFAPPTLVFTSASSAAQTDVLTIYTNPQQTAAMHGFFRTANAGSLAMLLWLPGSALALFGLRRKGALSQRMKPLLMIVLVVSGLGATGMLSGCANGTNFNSATPGTYTVPLTITATDGSMQTLNTSVTIQ